MESGGESCRAVTDHSIPCCPVRSIACCRPVEGFLVLLIFLEVSRATFWIPWTAVSGQSVDLGRWEGAVRSVLLLENADDTFEALVVSEV